MTSTTSIEKTTRTARQTAEMQRDSYEALAKNFSALQRRNAEFAQKWVTGGVELLRDQAEHNRRAAEVFSQGARKQQENLRALVEEWTGAYQSFFSPFTNAQRSLKAAQQTTQYTQQALQVTEQELRVAEQATEQATERVEKAEQDAARAQEATEQANAKVAKAEKDAEQANEQAEKAIEKATERANA
jgi:hypothetical protein